MRYCEINPFLREFPPLRSIVATLPLAALLISAPALAQRGESGDSITVGVGAVMMPDHEGSDDSSILPVPGALGSISGFNFLYLGNRLSVDLIRDGESKWDFQAGPMVSVGLNRIRLKSIDDARIRALGKQDVAVEVGGYVGIGRWGLITSEYDRASATVTVRHDVAGSHSGTIITPTVTYMTPLSEKTLVTIFASANHADGNYARTYFSISPTQSLASTLPVYNAEGGWKDWSLGAAGNIALTGDLRGGLSLLGGVTYTKMLGSIADSPVISIAGSRDQWMAGVGLAYTF